MTAAVLGIGLPLSIAMVIVQILYRKITVDDDAHISLRTMLKLRKIAPEKWRYSEMYNCMYYKADDDHSFCGTRVFTNTFIEAQILGLIEKRKEDPLADLRKEWIKDIDDYRDKLKEESDKEIQKSSDELKTYTDNIKSWKIMAEKIIAAQIDPSCITTSIYQELENADLGNRLAAIEKRLGITILENTFEDGVQCLKKDC